MILHSIGTVLYNSNVNKSKQVLVQVLSKYCKQFIFPSAIFKCTVIAWNRKQYNILENILEDIYGESDIKTKLLFTDKDI